MPEISISNIQKYYGAVHVLKGLSLDVPYGAKIGIVGGNGSGKTTLFRVISGEEPFEQGSMHIARNRRIGVLDQLPVYLEGTRVTDVIHTSFSELMAMKVRLDELAQTLTEDEEQVRRYGVLQSEFEHRGGYEMEHRFNRVTQGLNIPKNMQGQLFSELSGGEKTRVSLAQIILKETDILLLDEPTNHLDIQSVEWLEDFISDYRGTVLIISHDRYFLDQVAKYIFEVDDGVGQLYPGNYSAFSAQKEQSRIEAMARYESEQKKINQLETAVKRMHDWANRADNPKMHRRAFAMEKRLEWLERDATARPKTEKGMKNKFREEKYRGDEVLSVWNLKKQYDHKPVLQSVDFTLYTGERMALIGPNGCGKTTLLRTILSEIAPDSGTVKIGPSIRPGYLPQEITFEIPERSVIDTIRYTYPMDEEKARNLLAGYRFFGDDVFKIVSALSGGEKSRLMLCLLMQEDVNLLLLDEPTNHLDLPSREWIEASLDNFGGTIFFVSHDRYFIRRFANRIAEMDAGVVKTFSFDYESYRAWKEWKAQEDAGVGDDGQSPQTDSAKERMAVKEKNRNIGIWSRKCAVVEAEIVAAEERIMAIDNEMVEKATDFIALQVLTVEKEKMAKSLPQLYDDWESSQEQLRVVESE